MLMLTLGVALWSVAHLFKRLAPAARDGMGDLGKLVVTVALIGSLVMMISGYQDASGPVWWGRQPLWVSISNVLMLFALYMMVASSMKVRITSMVRHPQLTAIKAWSVSHLLVNGDLPSLILFGGLLGWAVVSVIIINRQDGKVAMTGGNTGWSREALAVLVSVGLYGAVAHAHAYLGYPVHG
ncbi:MAG: NnrU family protein [Gammaproteobacteria bacterium]|nr:NnrU family protein [Gammaproteobacteria bacterium]